MKIKNKLLISLIVSVGGVFLSLFFNTIPCKIAPNIFGPQYIWSACNLSPDTSVFGAQSLYFGFLSKSTDAYIFTFLLVFIVCFVLFSISPKLNSHKKDG